jgi:hypothetical protein
VTTGEDEPQSIVLDGIAWPTLDSAVQELSLLVSVFARVLAPDPVDCLVAGGDGQPRTGFGRYTVHGPPLNGHGERLGRCLLGGVEVAKAPGEDCDNLRPLLAVGRGNRVVDVGLAP